MKKKIVKFHPSFVFVVSLLAFIIPLCYYVFFWVPDRQDQLKNRYLRVTAMMGEQFENRGKNLAAVIKGIKKNNKEELANFKYIKEELSAWLESLSKLPDLGFAYLRYKPIEETSEDKKTTITDFEYNFAEDQFEFDIKKNIHAAGIPITLDFKAMIKADNFIGEICRREEFEDVFIINEKDEIIYSREQNVQGGIKSGLRISKIKSLFSEPGSKTGAEKNTQTTQISRDALHSYVLDLTIAQTDYKLFFQPIPLKFIKAESLKINEKHWFIGSLISADTFFKRSRQISNHILLLFALLLFMAFIGYPFLKLRLMGPRDSVRIRDVILLGVSLLIGIPMIIYFIITVSMFPISKANCERDLKALAQFIHDDFTREIQNAYDQLFFLAENKDKFLFREGEKHKPGLLAELKEKEKLKYPYFDMAFIMDEVGKQQYKRVVGDSFVTFHDVSHREYFKRIKNKNYWYTGNDEPMMLDPVHSKSTGRYEINLSIPLNDSNGLVAAGMSFRPLSVINPVLPQDYGFAVIDNEGKVLFHSDYCLNANENFFSESDQTVRIKAAIFTRAEDWMEIYYHGKRWNLYLMPVKNIPWTIAVLKNTDVRGSRTLERIFRTALNYLLYISALVLLMVPYLVLFYFRRKNAGIRKSSLFIKFRWIWPEHKLRLRYIVISLLNLFLFILLLMQTYVLKTPFMGSLVIPIIALLLVYLIIMKSLDNLYGENLKKYKIEEKRVLVFFKKILDNVGMLILILLPLFIFKDALISIFMTSESLVLAPIILYFFLLLVPGETGSNKFKRSWIYRHSHTLVIYSFFLLIIAYPALTFYNIAYEDEMKVAVKYNQLNLARRCVEWNQWRKDNYKPQEEQAGQRNSVPGTDPGIPGVYIIPSSKTEIKTQSQLFEENFMLALLAAPYTGSFKFLSGFIDPTHEKGDSYLTENILSMFTNFFNFIAKTFAFDDKYCEEIANLYKNNSPDNSLKWVTTSEDDQIKLIYLKYHEKQKLEYYEDSKKIEPFYVVSEIPRMKLKGGNTMLLGLGIFLIAFFLTVILFNAVHFIEKYIFLKDMESPPGEKSTIRDDEIKLIPGKFFIFGRAPDIIKKECKNKKKTCREIDCKHSTIYERFNQDFSLDEKFVVISNLDYKMHDAKANLIKLTLLERLLFTHDVHILLFSRFEPLHYFKLIETADSESGSDIVNRWKQVSNHFEYKYAVDPPPKKSSMKNLPDDSRAFIHNECDDTEYLQTVRELVFSDFEKKDPGDTDLPVLRDIVYQRAKPVYDTIWQASTREEKLVLIQLARQGLLNHKNKETIQRLLKRRLIRLSPLRFMNRTFRDYIIAREDVDSILKWKQTQVESNWKKVRRPFLFLVTGIILFLVLTQPNLLKSWLVLIPAISTVIPAILRLFDNLSGGSTAKVST